MKKKIIKFTLASILMACGLIGCGEFEPCTTHSWSDGQVVREATATQDGLKVYTCTVCKTTYTETLPALTGCEHTWDGGVVTKAATTTEDGVKTFTCSKCGNTKTESIPKGTEGEKFTVTYDANGGTGTGVVDLTEYSAGEKVIVKANTFTAPEGKEFINWCEEPDGSGSYHNVNSNFKIYENITLYAQWLDIEVPPQIDPTIIAHDIKVSATSGIEYNLSAERALFGTKVTFSITLTNGTTLLEDPTSPQVPITKTGNNTYEFTMPAEVVNINIRGKLDGDVVLTGDISTTLTDTDGDGIYTADVACDEKTSYGFSYVVKDTNGGAKRLSSMNLDETRTNANVTFTSGANELLIAGGSTYTFCYDSNAPYYNCYILRKSVDVLPMNSKTLFTLFDGKLRSQSTIHPQNLTSINYTKTVDGNDTEVGYKVTNSEYNYKKISNTESFAVATNKAKGDEKSYVYKNIDTTNNVYSIVNTYTIDQGNNEASDNVWGLDPYGDLQGDRYFPYSAKQDIVANSKYRDTSRYQITEREAYRNVSMAAHYGADLEYEIWKSIRGDFDGTAAINAANAEGSHINVTSTPRSGGFQTKVESQLEYNHEESGSTADVTQQYAYVYDITMVFMSNGDLYSMNYKEKFYTKNNWDFKKHQAKDGVTPITTTINVSNKYNETFAREDVLGDFNPNDYFITSINKLSFYDAKTGVEKDPSTSIMNFDDSLDIYEYLGGGKTSKLINEFTYSPSTALDAWQYGCIGSSDPAVVGQTPWGMKTVGVGTATATFGNHLENLPGATKDVSITVSVGEGAGFNSLYVNGLHTSEGYESTDHADYMYGYAGKTMKFYIESSNNTGAPISYHMVIVEKIGNTVYQNFKETSPYFNIVNGVGTESDDTFTGSFTKVVGHDLVLDFNTEAANALTKPVTVDIIFQSDYYHDGFSASTLHVVINPSQSPLANSKFQATYYYTVEGSEALSSDKFEDATVEFKANGVGVITETLYTRSGDVRGINKFNFSYTELNNGNASAHVTSVEICAAEAGQTPSNASAYTLIIERQKDGSIGVALYTDDVDLFGYSDVDEEGYVVSESLDKFEKVEG